MPMTFDQATVDSSGAFLIHELERLDQTLNLPLTSQTWSRDIQLREDVSIADEISSFTNTTFAAAGTLTPTVKTGSARWPLRLQALMLISRKRASRWNYGVWSLAGPLSN